MTLAEVSLPVDLGWARLHALVLSSELAKRLLEVQDEVGDGRYRLQPGGFLHAAFSKLDAARFDEIEVVPLADVLPGE